jgi:hypothetical protein
MALKACKECKKEISTEAKVCPNCGKKDPTAGAMTPSRGVIGVLVLIIFIAFVSAIEKNDAPAPAPETPAQIAAGKAHDSINLQLEVAKQMCHDAAMKSLESPATAQFHDDETYFKDLGKSRSHIQLQVDAQNGFGALVRTTVDCRTRQTANSVVLTSIDSWGR